MDLGAYAQIADLESLLTKNNIEVPRLRGLRLMKDEKPIDYTDMFQDIDAEVCKDLCESIPFWSIHPNYWENSSWTRFLIDYYCPNNQVCWDKIHGWKRRTLKFAIKQQKKKIKKQYDTFNKYAGDPNILYIHSRIGGNNWSYYGGDKLMTEPWFIERVDDYYDSTYCDIYARIGEKE